MDVAFIGVGGIARNYLGTLKGIPDVRVVGICEIDAARGQAVAAEFGARLFTDHRALLDACRPQAVFVCIPPFAHAGQERDVAAAGAALFVAKPVDLDLARARATWAAIAQSGVIHAVGYMWRYADITQKARELLAGVDLGLLLGQVIVDVPGTPWWRIHARSGGQIVEQATHIYDLMRYFAGEAAAVHGLGARRLVADRVDFADAATVNLRFASGAIGNVVSTCGSPDGRYCLEIVGRDARLQLHYNSRLTGKVRGETIDFTGRESGYAKQIHVFLEAVRTRRQSLILSDYQDALRTLELTLQADAAVEGSLREAR